MSLCPLDVSDRFMFSTIEASVWPLDSSTQLFDLPSSLPWLMKLHKVSVTSRVYPCNSHIGIPLGNLTTYPHADPDPRINTCTETQIRCVGMGMGCAPNTHRLPMLLPTHVYYTDPPPHQTSGVFLVVNKVISAIQNAWSTYSMHRLCPTSTGVSAGSTARVFTDY